MKHRSKIRNMLVVGKYSEEEWSREGGVKRWHLSKVWRCNHVGILGEKFRAGEKKRRKCAQLLMPGMFKKQKDLWGWRGVRNWEIGDREIRANQKARL